MFNHSARRMLFTVFVLLMFAVTNGFFIVCRILRPGTRGEIRIHTFLSFVLRASICKKAYASISYKERLIFNFLTRIAELGLKMVKVGFQ